MRTVKAKCVGCKHIWDVTSRGFSTCPKCGSEAIKLSPKPFAGYSPQGFSAFIVRMESPAGIHKGFYGGQSWFWSV